MSIPDSENSIFLSYRFTDEVEEIKNELVNYLGKLDKMYPIDLNDGVASSMYTLERSISYVNNADILILLLGHTYGTIPDGETESYIHLEYNAAKKNPKTKILIFCIGEAYANKTINYNEIDLKLGDWLNDLIKYSTVSFNADKKNVYKIVLDIVTALHNTIYGNSIKDENFNPENADDIVNMARRHYHEMGYHISSTLPLSREEGSIPLDFNKVFSVTKETNNKNYIERFLIIPILISHLSKNEKNTYQASLYWEYRFYIWNEDFFSTLIKEKIIEVDELCKNNIPFYKKEEVIERMNRFTTKEKDSFTTNNRVVFYVLIANYDNTGERKLLLNLTTYPKWYGTREIVGSKFSDKYPNINIIYEQLLTQFNNMLIKVDTNNLVKEKNNILVAEGLCKTFFINCDYKVYEYGQNNHDMGYTNNKNISIIDQCAFIVKKNTLSYYIDVNYKHHSNRDLFFKEINETTSYHNLCDTLVKDKVIVIFVVYLEDINKIELYKIYAEELIGKNDDALKPLQSAPCKTINDFDIESVAQKIFTKL